MTILNNASFAEVLEYFNKEHPVDLASPHFEGNKWGKLHLEQADRDAADRWSLCELKSEDIFSIVLPYHAAEHGTAVLVEESGLIVKDAIAKVQSLLPHYAEENPVCFAKMTYWQGKDFSPLFLSAKPAQQGRRSHVDASLGSIFHLDGLHRLMQWGMDGRFNADAYERGPKLTAYVAGLN